VPSRIKLSKPKRLTLASAAALLGFVGAQAEAAICTFGGSAEPSLQSQVNLVMGGPSINVQTDCIADGTDALWQTENQTGMVQIRVELAGNAGSNTFGLYDPFTNILTPLFEGSDSAGARGYIQVYQESGQWYLESFDTTGTDAYQLSLQTLSTSAFGFYLGTLSNGTFFSETGENSDGLDHMYAYGPVIGKPFDYILAWEDLITGQDRDYQDFVATLVDITPITVPLPPAVWLLASGLLGLGTVSRRRSA
jgi:hypothetical protein